MKTAAESFHSGNHTQSELPESVSCFQSRPFLERVGRFWNESAVFGTSRPFLERVGPFWHESAVFGMSRLSWSARTWPSAADRRPAAKCRGWLGFLPIPRLVAPARQIPHAPLAKGSPSFLCEALDIGTWGWCDGRRDTERMLNVAGYVALAHWKNTLCDEDNGNAACFR